MAFSLIGPCLQARQMVLRMMGMFQPDVPPQPDGAMPSGKTIGVEGDGNVSAAGVPHGLQLD